MSKAFSNWTHPEKKERIKLKDQTHKTRRNKKRGGSAKTTLLSVQSQDYV